MQVVPNPATTWATFDYSLRDQPKDAWLVVMDMQGRTMERKQVLQTQGQLVWDTRQVALGV